MNIDSMYNENILFCSSTIPSGINLSSKNVSIVAVFNSATAESMATAFLLIAEEPETNETVTIEIMIVRDSDMKSPRSLAPMVRLFNLSDIPFLFLAMIPPVKATIQLNLLLKIIIHLKPPKSKK